MFVVPDSYREWFSPGTDPVYGNHSAGDGSKDNGLREQGNEATRHNGNEVKRQRGTKA